MHSSAKRAREKGSSLVQMGLSICKTPKSGLNAHCHVHDSCTSGHISSILPQVVLPLAPKMRPYHTALFRAPLTRSRPSPFPQAVNTPTPQPLHPSPPRSSLPSHPLPIPTASWTPQPPPAPPLPPLTPLPVAPQPTPPPRHPTHVGAPPPRSYCAASSQSPC